MSLKNISCSHIHTKNQLNERNLKLIFQTYFQDEKIEIEKIEGDNGAVGEHYQSDILRLVVKLSTFDHPIKMIIKEPIKGFLSNLGTVVQMKKTTEKNCRLQKPIFFERVHHRVSRIIDSLTIFWLWTLEILTIVYHGKK